MCAALAASRRRGHPPQCALAAVALLLLHLLVSLASRGHLEHLPSRRWLRNILVEAAHVRPILVLLGQPWQLTKLFYTFGRSWPRWLWGSGALKGRQAGQAHTCDKRARVRAAAGGASWRTPVHRLCVASLRADCAVTACHGRRRPSLQVWPGLSSRARGAS